jgi:DNA invertase Pin-like site-specific DNA recombinase
VATYSYLRVSTAGQNLDKDRDRVLRFANGKKLGHVRFVEETISGKVSWKKRKLFDLIQQTNKGDSIIVCELSRLGRSMLECMEILSTSMNRGICIYAIEGNWTLDDSIQSKVVAMAFAMAAEIERDLISQRTKASLEARKAKGLPLGRPPGPGKSKLDVHRIEIEALLKNGSTQRFISKRYETTPANLNNWIKKHGITVHRAGY